MAWLIAMAPSGATPSPRRVGTSNTGPPVPVNAEPKPTAAPNVTSRHPVGGRLTIRSRRGHNCCPPTSMAKVAKVAKTTPLGSKALTRAPTKAAGMQPTDKPNTADHSTVPRRAYTTVPTIPVKRNAHVLVAVAACGSIPVKTTMAGASKTPPTPTAPMSTPLPPANSSTMNPTCQSHHRSWPNALNAQLRARTTAKCTNYRPNASRPLSLQHKPTAFLNVILHALTVSN